MKSLTVKLSLVFLALLPLPSPAAPAAGVEPLRVSLTEIPTPPEHLAWFAAAPAEPAARSPSLTFLDPGLGSWLSLGKAFYDIVSSLAGTMRIEPMTGAGVIPAAASSVENMEGWQLQVPKSYHLQVSGLFKTAFTFDYTVGFHYGGRYQGKGKFLANVAIIPIQAHCGWTWNCAVSAAVGQGVNMGTVEEPVAALPIQLMINMQGKVNSKSQGVHFTAYGDGRLEQTVLE